MNGWNDLLKFAVAIVILHVISAAIYLLSYAPFLALTPNSNNFVEFRSPAFYRHG